MALSQATDDSEGSVFTPYDSGASSDLTRLAGDTPTPDTKPPVQQATEGIISATVVEGPNTGADVTPPRTEKPNVQHVSDLFSDDPKVKEATAKTAQDARDKLDADEAADQSDFMRRHRAQAERINAAQGHTIGDLPPPWDEAQKSRDMIRGPLESFGSVASIFALAASAFTKQPALNALSASAAAMTAIHQSDAEGYERAYKAWKDNTDLVQKRFNMEQSLFNNAGHLFNQDASLWRAQVTANAVKFNDKHMLNLLDAGLDGDAFKLMEMRDRSIKASLEKAQEVEDFNTQKNYTASSVAAAEKKHPDWTPEQRAQYGLTATLAARAKTLDEKVAAQILQKKMDEKGELSSDDLMQFQRDFKQTRYGRLPSAEQALVEQIMQDPDLPPEEKAAKLKEVLTTKKGASANVLPRSKAIQSEIDTRTKKYEEQGMPHEQANDKATKEVLSANASPITGNRKQQLEMRAKNYEHSLEKINSVEKVLNSYVGAAGVAGKARRLAERLSDLAGSKKTDLVQMMRDVEYLKLEAPRLLLNADGRPLSAEAHRIDDIIGGLNAGDTTANTLRSMEELKKLYQKSKSELLGTMGAPTEPTPPAETKPWTPPAGDRPVAQ